MKLISSSPTKVSSAVGIISVINEDNVMLCKAIFSIYCNCQCKIQNIINNGL